MKKICYPVSLILLCLMLSGWGSKGHKKISQNFSADLPPQLSFLKPTWTNFVVNHASDADYRKNQDPDESPRHYIDIDNYPEFVQTGRITQDYDSAIAQHGYNFVIGQGILPWVIRITFDSLKSCFQRGDWNRSSLYAADLGHYVGDGHMPLHITNNYNGQITGQSGIHSRYESSLVAKYETLIVYPSDSAQLIQDVPAFIFGFLYENYVYVDSLLLADAYAKLQAGNNTSTEYYQALWARSGGFTIRLMRHASKALASLIYTAWVQAGSPLLYPNAIDEPEALGQPLIFQIFPNPAIDFAWFSVVIPNHPAPFTIRIFDSLGNLKDTIAAQSTDDGLSKVRWDFRNLAPGTYVCVLQSGTYRDSKKFIIGK